jgi:hypothetical protein
MESLTNTSRCVADAASGNARFDAHVFPTISLLELRARLHGIRNPLEREGELAALDAVAVSNVKNPFLDHRAEDRFVDVRHQKYSRAFGIRFGVGEVSLVRLIIHTPLLFHPG